MQLRPLVGFLAAACCCVLFAQDRLPKMPGYERWQTFGSQIAGSVSRGDVQVTWLDNGESLVFERDGKRQKFDVRSRKLSEFKGDLPAATSTTNTPNRRRPGPARGRQFTEAVTEDGKWKAVYRDRNLFVCDSDGKNEVPVTTDGSEARRVKYGSATWVYGEELGQREAMGWSPDGRKLWYYRFDESKTPDYFLTIEDTRIQNKLYPEAYVKAGAPNPEVDLYIFDRTTSKSQKVLLRNGAFDEELGHYIYGIDWSSDSKELRIHRTNRRQSIMEWCAAAPETGKVRVLVREEWPASWTENSPTRRFLNDEQDILKAPQFKNHAIWVSERNGFRNLYLLNLETANMVPITQHPFEVHSISKLDLVGKKVWYMARSAENPLRLQLHVAGLDGRGERRLTNPNYHHSVQFAPNGESFIDTYETIDQPPISSLCDKNGKLISILSESNKAKFTQLGLRHVERLEFPAWDGKTMLYGELNFPSQFDPGKKYPLLISVYAGPESGGGVDRFQLPDRLTEMGFLVASFDGRGTNGRGKAFKDEVYQRLGIIEVDDQAAGVKYLSTRSYVDTTRVGIHGTSYGGYASVMCILRYPELFQAACASSSVTDWRNYDSIYTERYMWTPQGNEKGYDAGSAMTYAGNLKGRLMLFYGTADDNVHPSNTYQLIRALQRAGKSFDLQIGPDQGHSGINFSRMMEFFVENLVLRKP